MVIRWEADFLVERATHVQVRDVLFLGHLRLLFVVDAQIFDDVIKNVVRVLEDVVGLLIFLQDHQNIADAIQRFDD